MVVHGWYWAPNFDPVGDTTEKVLVWVKFLGLPMEYYDHTFLFRIGEKIGTPKKIDDATSLMSRGKFARLCVEVDITKPLLSKFWLKKKVRIIEYEGIHLICFTCRTYGHSSEVCTQKRQTAETGDDTVNPNSGEETSEAQIRNMRKTRDTTIDNPEISKSFGPWMIAPRNNGRNYRNGGRKEGQARQGNNGNNTARKGSRDGGSRFAVLEVE